MIYIGVDVQTARGITWAAVNDDHESVGAGLLPTGPIDNVATALLDAIDPLRTDGLLHVGIEGIPVYNVENACASGSSAFNLAVQSLKAGTTDVALALGAEKMNIPDKPQALHQGGGQRRAQLHAPAHGRTGEAREPPRRAAGL